MQYFNLFINASAIRAFKLLKIFVQDFFKVVVRVKLKGLTAKFCCDFRVGSISAKRGNSVQVFLDLRDLVL